MTRGIYIFLALGVAVSFGGAAAAADELTAQRAEQVFSGAELLSAHGLTGASGNGAVAHPSPVPVGSAANSGCINSESCRAELESVVGPNQHGSLVSGSFNTTTRVVATNVFTASFGSGTIVLGNAAADAASAAAAR